MICQPCPDTPAPAPIYVRAIIPTVTVQYTFNLPTGGHITCTYPPHHPYTCRKERA